MKLCDVLDVWPWGVTATDWLHTVCASSKLMYAEQERTLQALSIAAVSMRPAQRMRSSCRVNDWSQAYAFQTYSVVHMAKL